MVILAAVARLAGGALAGRAARAIGKRLGKGGARRGIRAAGRFVKKHPRLAAAGAGLGLVGAGLAARKFLRGRAAMRMDGMPGRRRRGLVPKAVRRFISRESRRQKQVSKIMSRVVRMAGIKRPARRTSSAGKIDYAEALRALRD